MKRNSNNFPAHSRCFLLNSFIIIYALSSCITQRNVEYIQDNDNELRTYDEASIEDYKLKPKDELFIQISSLDDPSAGIFSSSSNQQAINAGTIEPYGASLASYTIDSNGLISLPVIGRVSVKGKTVKEVKELITNSLTKILSQPMVSVKLVNRYVTVLGEVTRPGYYSYSQDKITVYDALGLAGDITDYGNRKKVILIRNENGKNLRIPIDLTQPDILASNYLYVSPNDIIYIKPLKKKFWALRQFPYDVILSTITAAILFYSVIQ
jgi:polysaccharide export outer membrane protein